MTKLFIETCRTILASQIAKIARISRFFSPRLANSQKLRKSHCDQAILVGSSHIRTKEVLGYGPIMLVLGGTPIGGVRWGTAVVWGCKKWFYGGPLSGS